MLFLTTEVHAVSDSFYEGEMVTNAYLKKFKPGSTTGKYEQMRMFRRTSDNEVAYCIELWETLSQDIISGYDSNYLEKTNIKKEDWERIELIAYYGYGYKNHTTDNWYAASQFLIWKTLEKDSTIYFTDTLNGNKVDKFTSEMAEIENLIKQHDVLPSFSNITYTIDLSTNHQFVDNNEVLENFTVTTEDDVRFSVKSNQIFSVYMNHAGTAKFKFTKEDTENKTMLYVSPTSQNLIIRGNYPKISTEFTVKVEAGKLILRKMDKDTLKTIPQGDATFDGTTYELYNKNHKLMKTLTFNNNEDIIIENLPYGIYYLKEIKSGEGYKIDLTERQIVIQAPNNTFGLVDEVYKGKVKIQKYYEEGKNLIEEENAEFEIYDSKGNLVDRIKTDSKGQVEITLPYGTYRFHQTSGRKNCLHVEDFIVSIKEEINQEYQFTLKNEPLKRYLKVVKKEKETNKVIIVGNASFRIKNLKTSEYVTQKLPYPNGGMIDIFTTNEQGFFITPEPLEAGNYRLEEVSPPMGYQQITEPILFEVSEEIETVEIENYEKVICIEVYNEPKKGNLTIQKKGESFDINEEEYHYFYKPLENITFTVYADTDIISGSGEVLYKKGSLVGEGKTKLDGKLHFELPMGEYYVLESTFLDGYRVENKKYFVKIGNEGWDVSLNVWNDLMKGSLLLYKQDSYTKEPIIDTTFELYKEDGTFIRSAVTDEKGMILFDLLPVGGYYLVETKANKEYIISHEKYLFTIEDGKVENLTVENEHQIIPPHTEVNKKSVKRFLLLECMTELSIAYILVSRNEKKKYTKK